MSSTTPLEQLFILPLRNEGWLAKADYSNKVPIAMKAPMTIKMTMTTTAVQTPSA